MASVLKVTTVTKEYSAAENKNILRVGFDIQGGEEAPVAHTLDFPLETSPDQLKVELTNFLNQLIADKQQQEETAKQSAAEQQADQTIAAVTGMEIGVGNNDSVEAQPETPEQPAENQGAEAAPEQPAEPQNQ